MNRYKLLRVTTVPVSLKLLLAGQPEFFGRKGFEVLTASADGPERKDLLNEGVRHAIVPMTRKITPLRDIYALIKMVGVIRSFKPDIIHTHTPKAGLIGMLASWICGVKVRMHTVAGLPLMESTGIKRKLLILTERITYACATRVYPNSTGLKTFINQNISDSGKIYVLGHGSTNGIDVSYFKQSDELLVKARYIRKEHKIPPDAFVFCFVGRIVNDKGIREIIGAFKRLQAEETRPVYITLVGNFEQNLNPLDEADMQFLRTGSGIILTGFKEDVRPYILAADAFLFPSYREGFPNVVLQACALERCCIVSDINGCNEIIRHQQTGLLIRPKDVHAVFEAMRYVLDKKPEAAQLARYSRQFVSKNFDQQAVWNALLLEYKTLLEVG